MTRITAESLSKTRPETSPTLIEVLPRFRRHLAAQNKAPKTIAAYCEAVARLAEYLVSHGIPTRVDAVTSEHLESFIVDQIERLSAASARTRYASLRQFFKWLSEDEGEITASPMERMKPPKVPDKPVPVLTEDQLRTMLKIEKAPDFLSRRDAAILRLFIDTGARLAEVANLQIDDVNLDSGTVTFMGKGRRVRHNPIGTKAVRALDRYLVMRHGHPDRNVAALWLGTQGPMSSVGIALAMKRRAADAGVEGFHVHMLRHSAAHYLRLAGVDDDSVMRLLGWQDRSMLHRYGASAADTRAHAAHRRVGLGDRL